MDGIKEAPLFNQFLEKKGFVGHIEELDECIQRLCDERLKAKMRSFDLPNSKGFILYGAAGTGKKTLAKHIAEYMGCKETFLIGSHATYYDRKKIEELLPQYDSDDFSDEEEKVTTKPKELNQHKYAIIIDQIDCMTPSEIAGSPYSDAFYQETRAREVLKTLIGRIDSATSNIFFIGIAQDIKKVPKDLLCLSRLMQAIHVPNPTKEQRSRLFSLNLRCLQEKKLLGTDVLPEGLAELVPSYTGKKIQELCQKVNFIAFERMQRSADTVSASLITMEDFKQAIQIPSDESDNTDSSHVIALSFSEYLKKNGFFGEVLEIERAITPLIASFCSRGRFLKDLGVKAEKGILLVGLPGVGKTRMAGLLAAYLGCPKERVSLITGADLLVPFVGNTEQKIRNLFAPAKEAAKKFGNKSPLFVIVIDEIEAVLQKREGPSASVNAWVLTMVSQFLGEMDGLTSLNNLLVIGTTNRLSLIDKAFLRPGRFGTIIQIGYPRGKERKQILDFHLNPLKERKLVEESVDTGILAEITEGYSGAEIGGLIEAVKRSCLQRALEIGSRVQKVTEEGVVRPLTEEEILEESSVPITMAELVRIIYKRMFGSKSKL